MYFALKDVNVYFRKLSKTIFVLINLFILAKISTGYTSFNQPPVEKGRILIKQQVYLWYIDSKQ